MSGVTSGTLRPAANHACPLQRFHFGCSLKDKRFHSLQILTAPFDRSSGTEQEESVVRPDVPHWTALDSSPRPEFRSLAEILEETGVRLEQTGDGEPKSVAAAKSVPVYKVLESKAPARPAPASRAVDIPEAFLAQSRPRAPISVAPPGAADSATQVPQRVVPPVPRPVSPEVTLSAPGPTPSAPSTLQAPSPPPSRRALASPGGDGPVAHHGRPDLGDGPAVPPPAGGAIRAAAPRPAPRRRRKHSALGYIFGGLATVLILVLIGGAIWLESQARAVERTLPPVRMDLAAELPTKSYIYAADGTELAEIGLENRTWANLSDISPHVIDALLATEDRRFFEHNGIDNKRLIRAGWAALTGGDAGGASTLTMQLVRNVYPEIRQLPVRDRKVRELFMAQRLEKVYTKRDLLELYLNKMSFGRGAFGIEAAAETYFNKEARDLDVLQAALLVGVLKGPSYYDPVQYPERAKERRGVVLASMVEYGKLSEGVRSRLNGEPVMLDMAPRSLLSDTAPHFAEYVRREMEAWGRSSGFDIYRDGLRVFTTIDPYVQELAKRVVDREMAQLQRIAADDWAQGGQPFGAFWRQNRAFEDAQVTRSARFAKLRAAGFTMGDAVFRLRNDAAFMDSLRTAVTRLETGLVALDPRSGEVKAWVGSRNFRVDQYDKVASARRQPGSTFKPILYAAALEAGYTPDHLAEDVVTTYYTPPTYKPWRPTNAGGGASGGILTLRQALARSKNTVSARLVQQVGSARVASMARRLGITSDLLEVPSIALGTSEVTLLEMVSAYGAFVHEGVHQHPRVVSRVEDADGNVIATFATLSDRAMSPQTAYTLVDMLRGVTGPGGTGASLDARFPMPGEWTGKTGTTQDNTDGWFVAIQPNLVVGAWVGFNQPIVRFRSNYYGQGAHNAGVVVADFLQTVVTDPSSGIRPGRFQPPADYVAPAPPADPFAGGLIDPVRRDEYYNRSSTGPPGVLSLGEGVDSAPRAPGRPGVLENRSAEPTQGEPALVQPLPTSPLPSPNRSATSRPDRNKLDW